MSTQENKVCLYIFTHNKTGLRYFGKTTSENTKKKMSEARQGENNYFYGKNHSIESKKKMSEAHKGKKKPQKIVHCPYCNKEGAAGIMKRWHFDNCKYK